MMSVSVCLYMSLCLSEPLLWNHASELRQIVSTCYLRPRMDRSHFVGVAMRYVLPVTLMTSYLYTMVRNRRQSNSPDGSTDLIPWHIVKLTHRDQRQTDHKRSLLSTMTLLHICVKVTLSIHLNDSEVDEFEKQIPVELAQPPWNYSDALEHGIQVGCDNESAYRYIGHYRRSKHRESTRYKAKPAHPLISLAAC